MTDPEPTLAEKISAGVRLPDHVGTPLGKSLFAVAKRDLADGGLLRGKAREANSDAVVMRIFGEEILRRPQWAAKSPASSNSATSWT